MSVGRDDLVRAIQILASVEGMQMDPAALAQDVLAVADAWPTADEFRLAIAATRRVLERLVSGAAEGTPLKYNLSAWSSLHYQHKRAQGQRADMRVVYQRTEGEAGIRVRGFGHRHVPQDVYRRLRGR